MRNDFSFTFDLLQLLQSNEGMLHDRKSDGHYHPYSTDEIGQFLGSWRDLLQEHHLGPGDSIILVPASASSKWLLLDLLAQSQGIRVVLIHATVAPDDLVMITNQTKAKLVVTMSESTLKPNIAHLGIDHRVTAAGFDLKANSEIDEEDVCSVIYTSGTSGKPKGVQLSHRNIMSNARAIALLMPMGPQHSCISFLPYSHAFERTIIYAYILRKTNLYFIGGAENLGSAFTAVRPHFVTAVPRVLERMFNQVATRFKNSNPVLQKLFEYALALTKRYEPHRAGIFTQLQVLFVRHILLGAFRKQLGGRLIAIMVGAAHLRPVVARSFAAIGVRVREGYGMTEASPVITVNRFEPGLHRLGTVGLPLPGVDVRISNIVEAGSGEIEFKGPNLMQGYLGEEALTKERLTSDGFFKTGDIGHFDQDGFLIISDRAKDIFKTSSGKYISPAQLTNHFIASPYIQDVFIIGFQRPFVTALIYPDFELLQNWATSTGVHWTSEQYMVHNVKVRGLMDKEIESLNDGLPNYKKLRAYHLMHEPFSASKGEISSTLKPIRKSIIKNYVKEIEKLYL